MPGRINENGRSNLTCEQKSQTVLMEWVKKMGRDMKGPIESKNVWFFFSFKWELLNHVGQSWEHPSGWGEIYDVDKRGENWVSGIPENRIKIGGKNSNEKKMVGITRCIAQITALLELSELKISTQDYLFIPKF